MTVQERKEPEPAKSPLQLAAHRMWEHFDCGHHPHWIQCIGIAAKGPYNDTDTIKVVLVREPYPHEGQIPDTWDGFPVETMVGGSLAVMGGGD